MSLGGLHVNDGEEFKRLLRMNSPNAALQTSLRLRNGSES
jgi:hypothetical protein